MATERLAAQIAAHESWANTPDRTARTAPARAALDAKFLEQAGGDPVRAAHLRKAHFARLALKSAQARQARKASAAGSLEDYIRRTVDAAPPLTPEQRDRLALALRGKPAPQPYPLPKEAEPTTRSGVVVYRHFDACGCLLYVGITSDFSQRSATHQRDSWWSRWAVRIEKDERGEMDREAALSHEARLIKSEFPVFNTVHAATGRDERIVRYLAAHSQWSYLHVGSATGEDKERLIEGLVAANVLHPIHFTKEPI